MSLVACASEQEKREAEDRLRESLVALEVTFAAAFVIDPRVECSDQIDADKGDRFACTVTAPDRTGPTSVVVKAIQTDDSGGVRLLTKLLDTRKVQGLFEGVASDRVKDIDNVSLSELIDCPDLVVVKEGARFTCRGAYSIISLSDKSRQPFKLIATFTGDRDKFTYRMRLSERCHPGNCQDQ